MSSEHFGLKINRAITYLLVLTSVCLALVAAFYFIKAAME